MTSLASPDQPNFSSSFENSNHKSSAQKPTQEDSVTPVRRQNKPRTRSAILKASSQLEGSPGTPRKRSKKTKKRGSRSNSPVIDLTGEDAAAAAAAKAKANAKATAVSASNSVHNSADDSPLRRVRSKLRSHKNSQQKVALNSESTTETSATKTSSNSVVGAETTEATSIPLQEMGNESDQHKKPVLPQLDSAPEEQESGRMDLDSSPIKKPEKVQNPELAPELIPKLALGVNFSSSPTKKLAKSVAFSDSLAHEGPSSPISPAPVPVSQTDTNLTPKRSILKPSAARADSSPLDPNNSSMWMKTTHSLSHQFSTANHSPSNPLFWQPGTIIQLEPRSHDLPQLVDGCLEVLKDKKFDKKFEVYATLNLVCRTNDVSTVVDLFSGETSPWLTGVEKTKGYKPKVTSAYIKNLCQYAKRDMDLIESKLYVKSEHPSLSPTRNDPFESRTLTQSLKLVSYFLAMPSLNSLMSASDIKWFYNRACDVIVKPNLSKSLVSPYLSILKDCHFPSKKRKLLFESYPNAISEKMLFAILNMKNYLSSSLINEKFIALRNLIQNFPAVSAKHFHTWFPGLLVNLCDLSFVLYSKVVGTGITTLLEAARNYLDNNDICLYTRKFIESPLKTDHGSWVTESLTSSSVEGEQLALDYVVESLKSLLESGFYKFAMDIWVGITLLLGKYDDGFETWKHIGTWLQVHKMCFNENSLHAKETALSSWKVMVYKVCCYDLKDSRLFLPTSIESPGKSLVSPNLKQTVRTDEILRQKIRLLIHPFMCITNAEIRKELVDGFHNLFLSILYNLVTQQQKLNAKYLQTIWDKIIQPVLLNFYFKKDHSNAYMHMLGLTVMNKLLKPSAPVSEKSYTNIRCLSQEPINISEIGSLNPRWVYLRFDKVLPVVSLILKSKQLNFESKAEGLLCFLDSIKYVTKKEVQISDTTFDLIDNLPLCLDALLNESKVSYNHLNRVILSLNDTFGAVNLVSMTEDTKSVVEPILWYSLRSLATDQAQSIIGLWYSAIGEKKNLKFLSILHQVNRDIQRTDVTDFIAESLNSKKNTRFLPHEMVLIGEMFQVISHDFNSIAKKIIQQIVLLKTEEFEAMIVELGLVKWNINVFNFFVVLMHDAPYDHLKQATVSLIGEKAGNAQDFRSIVEVLLVNKFDFEISHLRREIVETIKAADLGETSLETAWQNYIKDFDSDISMLDDLLVCACHSGLNVKELVGDKWEKLPNFRAAWVSEFGSHAAGNSVTESVQSDTQPDAETAVEKVSENDNKQQLSESISDCSLENPQVTVPPKESMEVDTDSSSQNATQVTNNKGKSKDSLYIEISSDDRQEHHEDETNTNQVQSLEITESVSSYSEDTSISARNKGRKRKHAGQDLSEAKRFHFSDSDSDTPKSPPHFEHAIEDIKQVSDSDKSNGEKEPSEDPNRGVEVTSSSEEKRRASEEINMPQALFQGQSTANNTSDELLEGKDKKVISTALETVDKQPVVVESLQHPEKVKPTALHEIFRQITDEDLACLTEKERYDLETGMMEFILRMRRAKKE